MRGEAMPVKIFESAIVLLIDGQEADKMSK